MQFLSHLLAPSVVNESRVLDQCMAVPCGSALYHCDRNVQNKNVWYIYSAKMILIAFLITDIC